MKRHLAVWPAAIALTLALTSCGTDDDGESTSSDVATDAGASAAGTTGDSESNADGGSGAVADPAPPGSGTASVDGLDLDLALIGGLDCAISDEAITFAYRIGDNEFTLGGGLNRVDGGWLGSIRLTVANPDGEAGPIAYYPEPGQDGVLDESLIGVADGSMSYAGPMLKQPANDGSNPPPVNVGDGTFSASCA